MTLLADHQIKRRALEENMITPFVSNQVREVGDKKVISYGLSSYGYDFRVADEFMLFKNHDDIAQGFSRTIDPLSFDENICEKLTTDILVLPPRGFALARSIEYFNIPRDVLALCTGKSTLARCGINVNLMTPAEPNWSGYLTIEISNTTNLYCNIYANQGISQMLFFKGEYEPMVSYEDRGGKYQNQSGIVLPKG